MKNLVVFAMIMLILASGYMYGTKLATDMGINKIPTLDDIGSNGFGSDNSGKGVPYTSQNQPNPLNGLMNELSGLWSSLNDFFNGLIYSLIPASTKDSGNSNGVDNSADIISKEEAKIIAQKYIEEQGAIPGEPLLVNYNGKLVYIVPVLLNGVRVGEIYIDAQTGQNLGGAGGVNDNEINNSDQSNDQSTNSGNNNPNKGSNDSNPDIKPINNESVKEEPNNNSIHGIGNNQHNQ